MILMYHKVGLSAPTRSWVEVDRFYEQMAALRRRQVVFLDDYDPCNPQHVAITFDGGYEVALEFAVPILEHFGHPFEIFVVGDLMGGDNAFDAPEPTARFATRAALIAAARRGGRLQWHTRTHPKLTLVDATRVEQELAVPEDLARLDPAWFRWFAYPYGEFDAAVLETVRSRFVGALSCVQGDDDDRHRLNRITVTNATVLPHDTVTLVLVASADARRTVLAVDAAMRQGVSAEAVVVLACPFGEDAGALAALSTLHASRVRVVPVACDGLLESSLIDALTTDYVCVTAAGTRLHADAIERLTGLPQRSGGAAAAGAWSGHDDDGTSTAFMPTERLVREFTALAHRDRTVDALLACSRRGAIRLDAVLASASPPARDDQDCRQSVLALDAVRRRQGRAAVERRVAAERALEEARAQGEAREALLTDRLIGADDWALRTLSAPLEPLPHELPPAVLEHLRRVAGLLAATGAVGEAMTIVGAVCDVLAARDVDALWLTCHYMRASLATRAGEPDLALQLFGQVIARATDDLGEIFAGGAYFHRGVLLEQRGDAAAAEHALTACLAIQPDHARARAALARVQERTSP